jgi:hypothetical protein
MADEGEWTPPAKLLPITAEAYAGLRTFIDGGTKAAQARIDNIKNRGCRKDCLAGSEPPISTMAEELYKYIPYATMPLPAESIYLTTDGQVATYAPDDTDRGGVATFEIPREVLIQALNDATPVDVLEKFNDADPNNEGLPWWVEALAAAGVFALLGKLNWRGALLSRIAARLLLLLASAGLFPDLSEGAKQIIEKVKDVAKTAIGAVPWILGGGLLLGGVYLALRRPADQKVQLQLTGAP